MKAILLTVAILLTIPALSIAQSRTAPPPLQGFTIVNPMTGHVTSGSVSTMPNGSQSYLWVDSTTGHTTTGFLSGPTGDARTYSTFDTQSLELTYGSIFGPQGGSDMPLLGFGAPEATER